MIKECNIMIKVTNFIIFSNAIPQYDVQDTEASQS